MNSRHYFIFFLVLLASCLVILQTSEAPLRNYAPVIWGLLGYGLTGLLFIKTWLSLSKLLIDDHLDVLDEKGISFVNNGFKKTVSMFDLASDKHDIEEISSDIRIHLTSYRTYLWLSVTAFILTAVLSVLSVLTVLWA